MKYGLIIIVMILSIGAFADTYDSVESKKDNVKWVQPDLGDKISVDMVLAMLQGQDTAICGGENICQLLYHTMHDWLEFQRCAKAEVLRIYNTGLYVGLYSTDIYDKYLGEKVITDFQRSGFDLETIKTKLKSVDSEVIKIHRQIIEKAISSDEELKEAYDERDYEYKRVCCIIGEETSGQFEKVFLNSRSFDEVAIRYDSLSMRHQKEQEEVMMARRHLGKKDMDELIALDSAFKLKLFNHITSNFQAFRENIDRLKEASLKKALLVAEMRMIEKGEGVTY